MARILLVDDVKLFRHMEATVLGSYGYTTEEASSGAEAMEKIRAHPPDLALVDVAMPGMDGLEVCRQIKSDPTLQSIPVIMVSSSNREEDIRKAVQAGCDEYLTKPLDDTTLLRKVEELLGRTGKRRFSRVPTSLQISFEDFKGIFFEYTRDISRSGVFIEMDNPLPVGSRLRLSFSLPPPYDHPVMAFGRVVRTTEPSADRPGGMGVSFICLDERSGHVIDELVVAGSSAYEDDLGVFSRVSVQTEGEGLGTPSLNSSRVNALEEECRQLKLSLESLQQEHLRQSAAYTLVETLHSQLEPKQLLGAALDILGDLLGASSCGIFLCDPEKNLLIAAGSRGLPASASDHLPLQGPIQQALTRCALEILDPPWPIPGTATQLLAVSPILHGSKALGIVTINRLYTQKPHLDNHDHHLLRLLGKHLGSALWDAVARTRAGDQPAPQNILKAVL